MIGHPAERFERLVLEIFQLEGFTIEREVRLGNRRADAVIRDKSGKAAVVDIKLYRSRQVSFDVVERALVLLEGMRRFLPDSRAIFVMSSDKNSLMDNINKEYYPNVTICDYSTIRALAARNGHIIDEFDKIVRETSPSADFSEGRDVDLTSTLSLSQVENNSRAHVQPIFAGDELRQRLMNVKPGIREANLFESEVASCLKYIFEKDMVAWQKQQNSDGGLSRYDLIARVSSSHDFWHKISTAFRSHYIIFEFKNNKEKIKQTQIYTTEKYLFSTAMRSTAIIISRNGPDKNAEIAARGALRETGKLIINLTIDDLSKMLTLRDQGGEHNGVLVDVLDQMLMRITR